MNKKAVVRNNRTPRSRKCRVVRALSECLDFVDVSNNTSNFLVGVGENLSPRQKTHLRSRRFCCCIGTPEQVISYMQSHLEKGDVVEVVVKNGRGGFKTLYAVVK